MGGVFVECVRARRGPSQRRPRRWDDRSRRPTLLFIRRPDVQGDISPRLSWTWRLDARSATSGASPERCPRAALPTEPGDSRPARDHRRAKRGMTARGVHTALSDECPVRGTSLSLTLGHAARYTLPG